MTMEWEAALEIVVARTGHERYRVLCDESHPDHAIHRRRVIELATATPREPSYPSLARQALNLAGAAGRVVAAVANGVAYRVSEEEHARRLAICQACEFHDAAKRRCTKCGCGGAKLHLATERCPLEPPRW